MTDINPYQVMLRTSGFYSIDVYDGDEFIDISISNIKPYSFAKRIADELNAAFNDGMSVGRQMVE